VLFVIFDVVMVLFFVNRVSSTLSSKLGSGAVNPSGSGLMGLLSFIRGAATELDRAIVEYLQANYSGHKEQLPEALRGAVERARSLALSKSVTVDEDTLRTLVVQIAVSHKIASRADALEAMRSLTATPQPVE